MPSWNGNHLWNPSCLTQRSEVSPTAHHAHLRSSFVPFFFFKKKKTPESIISKYQGRRKQMENSTMNDLDASRGGRCDATDITDKRVRIMTQRRRAVTRPEPSLGSQVTRAEASTPRITRSFFRVHYIFFFRILGPNFSYPCASILEAPCIDFWGTEETDADVIVQTSRVRVQEYLFVT